MTNRYTSFEATAAAYTSDTHTFTANRHDIDVVTEEVSAERGNIYPVTTKGRTPRTSLKGPVKWTGNIETLLYTKHAPSLLYYALGASAFTVDTPTVGSNTHTLTPASTIPDFILETGRDYDAFKYTGCAVTGWSVDLTPDAAVSVNFDINARKEQPTAALGTVTFPDFNSTERTFSGVEVISKTGTAEGGAPTDVSIVESANISYENNFEDDAFTLSSRFLSGLFVNQIALTGSLELSVLNWDQYDFAVADTNREWWFVATNGLTLTASRGYTFKLPRVVYDTAPLTTTNAERYVQSIDFTAVDDASGNAIKIDINNAQTNAEFIA